MTARCYLCDAGIIVAASYQRTVTVDALPHSDGQLTLSRRGLGWWASTAKTTPYARETPLYRTHKCQKASAA